MILSSSYCCLLVFVCFSLASRHVKKRRVWVDLDFAAGLTTGERVHDVDDALALIQLLASPEVVIVGISPVHANAPMEHCMNATNQFLIRYFSNLNYTILAGATGTSMELTPAVKSLAGALSEDVLTLLALGSLSNVATLLKHFPHLHPCIEQVIFVGGRRAFQVFRIGNHNNDSLPDLNFDRDRDAASILLESDVPVVLAPFELSQKVSLSQAEVDQLRKAGTDMLHWLANVAQAWLDFWKQLFKVDYFHPFDNLAVMALTHPEELQCDVFVATIRRGARIKLASIASQHGQNFINEDKVESQLFLDVSSHPASAAACNIDGAACREVKYCHTPSPRVKSLIMKRLVSHAKVTSHATF